MTIRPHFFKNSTKEWEIPASDFVVHFVPFPNTYVDSAEANYNTIDC